MFVISCSNSPKNENPPATDNSNAHTTGTEKKETTTTVSEATTTEETKIETAKEEVKKTTTPEEDPLAGLAGLNDDAHADLEAQKAKLMKMDNKAIETKRQINELCKKLGVPLDFPDVE